MAVRLGTPHLSAARPAVGAAALSLAAVAWGSTFVVVKWALEDVGPFLLLAVRFPIAVLALAPVALAGAPLGPALRHRAVWLLGLVLAAHFGLQTVGLVVTTASRGALIVAVIPAVTALLAVWLLHERVTARLALGIALSIAGVGIIIGLPVSRGDSYLGGDLLVLASVVGWAVYTVQARDLLARHSPVAITFASTVVATPLLLAGGAVEWAVTGPPGLSPRPLLLVAYLAVVGSAVATLLWNIGLRHLPAATAGPFVNLVPVTGVAFGVLAGDSLGWGEVAGATVVAAGLWLALRERQAGRGCGG